MKKNKTDESTTVGELKNIVKKFCEERDWNKYHSPKNLAIGIVTEASELLEIFRWASQEESYEFTRNPEKLKQIKEELADVLYFVLRFAEISGIDLSQALKEKIEINEKRYPIEKSKGLSKKYTEL